MENNYLKKLVGNNEVFKAMEEFEKLELSRKHQNELSKYKQEWQDVEVEKNSGTRSYEQIVSIKNRISLNLLTLIDEHFNQASEEFQNPATIQPDREIKVSLTELRMARGEKTKHRHQRKCSFLLRLVESDQYIRVNTFEGMPVGKLAEYLAKDLHLVDEKLFAQTTWRLEKVDRELPQQQDLGAANIQENDILYLTSESKPLDTQPDYITFFGGLSAIEAIPAKTRDDQVTKRAVTKNRKTWLDPNDTLTRDAGNS